MRTNRINVVMPYEDLQAITEQYLRHATAIRDDQMVTSVNLPIEVNDEDMIELTVGVLEEGVVN